VFGKAEQLDELHSGLVLLMSAPHSIFCDDGALKSASGSWNFK
jgi:hypothetical protein